MYTGDFMVRRYGFYRKLPAKRFKTARRVCLFWHSICILIGNRQSQLYIWKKFQGSQVQKTWLYLFYLITSLPHHLITSLPHHLITSSPHYLITSSPHYLITSFFFFLTHLLPPNCLNPIISLTSFMVFRALSLAFSAPSFATLAR